MKNGLNNIFQYKALPTIQNSLQKAFSDMKTSSTDPEFLTIPVWVNDTPAFPIHLHEGLVASDAMTHTVMHFPTINGHAVSACRETQSAAADELKESVDN